MPLLLAEAAKLCTDVLQRGVIETIIKDSPILQALPFMTVEGNSYKYVQENTLGNADFYGVNAVWAESAPTYTQATASLAILGGDADVDNFIQRTRTSVQDQRAVVVAKKAKAVAHKFEQQFINGTVAGDPNAFDGLQTLITAGQTMWAGADGAALTLAMVDSLIDLVQGGKPDLLLMSKRSRRKLKSLLQNSTHYVERGESSFGRQVMMYDGIPIEVTDFQPDTEVRGASGAVCSSIYALSFGAQEALSGLQNGGIEVIDVGQLESKDASRVRIRWYCGLALFNALRCARLGGVNAA